MNARLTTHARPLVALLVALAAVFLAIGQQGQASAAADPVNLAPEATPSAEYTAPWNSLGALNDGAGVTQGGAHTAVWGSYSGSRPATRWVQYDWATPVTVSATEVLFWHDAQPGTGDNVAVPQSWEMLWWDATADTWTPVPSPSAYGTNQNAHNRTTFESVETTRVRIVLHAAPNAAGTAYAAVAVSEWGVFGSRATDPPPDDDDPIAVDVVHIPTTVGVAPDLPQQIVVTRVDGLREAVDVAWGSVASALYSAPGSFEVEGDAATVQAPVSATVWVRPVGEDGGGIVEVELSSALTVTGVAPHLPEHVVVVYEDGTRDSSVSVTWRALDPAEYAVNGIVELTGTVEGSSLEAMLLLVVDTPAATEDTVAPSLSVSLDPERPATTWWTGPVTASFAASDAFDPAPLVEHRLDGGEWLPASGAVVDGNGLHTLEARASDVAGNVSSVQEVEIGIDTIAPEVTSAVDTSAAQSTITLTAEDATSGVATIQYAIGEEFEATYAGPVVVDRTNVDQQVRFTATDEAGNKSEPQTMTVRAAGPVSQSVSGSVSSVAGPVEGACVYLYASREAGSASYGSCTDAGGGFSIPGVVPGSYEVAVADPAGGFATRWVDEPVVVAAGPVVGLDLTVVEAQTGRLVGGVTEQGSGEPLGSVCAFAYPRGVSTAASYATCTDAAGRYGLYGVASGEYDVAFYDPSGVHPTQWWTGAAGGAGSQSGAAVVVVPTRGGAVTVDAVMDRQSMGAVGGVVREGGGAPVAGVCVYLYAAEPGPAVHGTCSQADGSWWVGGVQAGVYRVAFADPEARFGTQWWTGAAGGAPGYAGGGEVTVAAGQSRLDLDAAMEPLP